MNYKPDESTLIAYLYDELDAKEVEKVQDYLNQNPEALKKLQGLNEVRNVLSHADDQEVIAPPIFMDTTSHASRFWQSGYFKTIMSIAASIVFLLVAARLIGPEISYSGGELRISFNRERQVEKPMEQVVIPSLSSSEVQDMINTSLAKNNEQISSEWENHNKKLQASLKNIITNNSEKIDELMKVASQASQDQVRTFVASLQQDNLQLMKDYMQLSAKDQKTYVESLLVDFSKYFRNNANKTWCFFKPA